jgi:hypothetical protein
MNIQIERQREYEIARDQKLYDPSFKGGVGLDLLDLRAQAKLSNGAILTLLHTKEKLYKDEHCGMSSENGRHTDLLNNVTIRLFEAGIIQHWMDESKKFLDFNYYQRPLMLTKEYLHQIYPKTHPEGPQELDLFGLEAGFVIYLAATGLSLLAFGLEWLCRFKDYLIVHYLLTAFYEAKRPKEASSLEGIEVIQEEDSIDDSTEGTENSNSIDLKVEDDEHVIVTKDEGEDVDGIYILDDLDDIEDFEDLEDFFLNACVIECQLDDQHSPE